MQQYDFQREVDKLEQRLLREIDRRFLEVQLKLDELEKQAKRIEEKIDTKFQIIEEDRKDSRKWAIRYIITTVIAIAVGSGASGFINILSRFLGVK